MDVRALAKLAYGTNPRIPPMKALEELGRRTDDLGGEPRSPRARAKWRESHMQLFDLRTAVMDAFMKMPNGQEDSDAEADDVFVYEGSQARDVPDQDLADEFEMVT